jgi:hypothetical protein
MSPVEQKLGLMFEDTRSSVFLSGYSAYKKRREGAPHSQLPNARVRRLSRSFNLVHEPKTGTVLNSRMRHDAQGLDTF